MKTKKSLIEIVKNTIEKRTLIEVLFDENFPHPLNSNKCKNNTRIDKHYAEEYLSIQKNIPHFYKSRPLIAPKDYQLNNTGALRRWDTRTELERYDTRGTLERWDTRPCIYYIQSVDTCILDYLKIPKPPVCPFYKDQQKERKAQLLNLHYYNSIERFEIKL